MLDRSASLRHADPDERGPRLLAVALGLALQPGERLAVFATGGSSATPASVGQDTSSLATLLGDLLNAPTRPGGADLRSTLRAALKEADGGLVIVFTDDDLDVVTRTGVVPSAILARAKTRNPRPTRTDVNAAAAELLAAGLESSRATVIGLRAPLPLGARNTPFLERLGADTVDLSGDDLAVVAALAERVRGEPIVASGVVPKGGRLELPYPARVAIAGEASVEVSGAAEVSESGGRLWLTDAQAGNLTVSSSKPVRCLVSPRLDVPDGVVAYSLRNGSVQVVALREGSPNQDDDRLVARIGSDRVPLTGAPPSALLTPAALPERVALTRVVRGPDGRSAVAGHGAVSLTKGELLLDAPTQPEADRTLRVEGLLPPGLSLARLPIEVREASGSLHQVDLLPTGEPRQMAVSLTPRSAGRLEIASQGSLSVRLREPVVVQEAVRRLVVIEGLADGKGVPLTSENPLLLDGDSATLRLTLSVDPQPPEPFSVEVTLKGAPVGAHFEASPAVAVQGKAECELTLRWPDSAGSADVSIRCRELTGAAVPATRIFRVKPPVGRRQALLAAALIGLGLVWFTAILIRRSKRARYLLTVVGERQLRTVGSNGRLSHETYLLRNYMNPDNSIVVEPEASPGGAVAFTIREDEGVDCEGVDGAQVIHSARPALLTDRITLRHGTPFAMVCGDQALRYVYLDREPTADEIQTPYLADAVSQEAGMADSGIFLILDQEAPVLPRYSARLDASQETVFPLPDTAEEASEEVDVIPPSEDALGLSSDEGILYMNSDEGRIMDTHDELRLLTSQEDAMGGGLEIRMSDLMPREDLDDDDD